MKISLVSDLHLEMAYQELSGGEVLILGGDIAESRHVQNHFRAAELCSHVPSVEHRCWDFFLHECAKYQKVFYVMGNHEHYRGKYHETKQLLESMMPANVSILENQAVEYEGVMFMGATLWTDVNRGDPVSALAIKQNMNDYRAITMLNSKQEYHKLTTDYTQGVHRTTLEYFKKTLEEHAHKPFVVMTHHAPSRQSIHETYKHDYHMNGGYVSDLDDFILDHPNIHTWTHGHTHTPFDYKIGNTRVLCNPRGYVPYEADNGFDPHFTFEI